LKAGCEFFLRQAERAPERLGAGYAAHPGHVLIGERLSVRVAAGNCLDSILSENRPALQ
jgi:hypothetical protein